MTCSTQTKRPTGPTERYKIDDPTATEDINLEGGDA